MPVLLLAAAPALAQAVYSNVDNGKLQALMDRGVPVVDVRTAGEWKETGTVKGAHRITAFDDNGRPVPDFTARLAAVAKPGDEVVLVCRSGSRTKVTADALTRQLGYSRVYNVEKGMRAWLAEGRPVER
ncbi:MAG: rhodanese-like domain-containing protein [Magnetospirillum sp.]|nr:rhodanese-like domain-containing protein [Magnetospirillum sp.]